MEWNKDSWVWLLLGVALGVSLILFLDKRVAEDGMIFTTPDTTYNRIKLDSISVKLGKRDTTIYNLKIKLKEDVEKTYALDDSSTVELFKQLATQSDSKQ